MFGTPAAPGLRAFIVSDEVSPDWLARLRVGISADPWQFGFAVVHTEQSVVIGNVGFTGPPDGEGVVEIAYGIVPDYQGKGLATEAARAALMFALSDLKVRKIVAHTLPQTNASTRVLEKLGFARAGEAVDPQAGPVWKWERKGI